jgi:hypothetical protein
MAKRSSRAIGTSAESAVVAWLTDNGWPTARRQPLYGSKDQGDIIVCESPKVLVECKAGAAAETASAAVIETWLDQTDTEAVNAGADLGVLIVRRFRRPVAQWDAWMRACDWALLLTGDEVLPPDAPWPMRVSLEHWSVMAKAWADL